MTCFHDFELGKIEEDMLDVEIVAEDTMEVREVVAAGRLDVLRLKEEGGGWGMVRLENTDTLSGGLCITD